LVLAELLLEKLSHIVEHFFVAFILREVLFVVLYQLLHLLVQLFFRNLLTVDQLHILWICRRMMILALVVLHKLLDVLTALRSVGASEVVDVDI
jgi:hypothetical protein